VYYCRLKFRGKLYWRSLGVSSATHAKLRLPDVVSEIKSAAEPVAGDLKADSVFRDAFLVYKAEVNGNARLAKRTKEIRLQSERTLCRTWPELFELEIRRITAGACKDWLQKFENGGSLYRPHKSNEKTIRGDSPTTVNGCIRFLRYCFDLAISQGIIYRNPAKDLALLPRRKKVPIMPNKTQFADLVRLIRTSSVWGGRAGDLVEGLAYSGCRIGELRKICWGHLDFEKKMMRVLGTKSESSHRVIPMTSAFITLIKGIEAGKPDERVFVGNEATESLKTACKKIGITSMTHHDLRHYFATTVIESGIDIPTLAGWLGHSDGGVLAMSTYGHLRVAHSTTAAEKVNFA
jgi:integrase